MKKAFLSFFVAGLLLLSAFALAQAPVEDESGCPADKAAEKNITLIKELHGVIAPAWHAAYPAKDYAALGDAIEKLRGMLPKIENYATIFKTVERKADFEAARERFIAHVEAGRKAKDAEDNGALYNLIPGLHQAFEEMAASLLPLRFPEFTSLQTSVADLVNTQLKNEDFEAIRESMVSLRARVDTLQAAALPEALTSVKKEAGQAIVEIGKLCDDLGAVCREKDTEDIAVSLGKLNAACDEFEKRFL